MRLYVSVFILCFYFINLSAQSYHPKEGDEIVFYEVADKIKEQISGYDCVYDEKKLIKKGVYNIKSKNRFNKNKQLLTPYNEIENHIFNINKIVKLNPYTPTELLAIHITRDDDARMVICVPIKPNILECNILTRELVKTDLITEVLLPCMKKSDLMFYKGLIGKEFVLLQKKENKYAASCMRINSSLFNYSTFGQCVKIQSLVFRECDNSLGHSPYLQPFFSVSESDSSLNEIPIEVYINIYNSYSFKTSFIDKYSYINMLKDMMNIKDLPQLGKYNYGVKEKYLNFDSFSESCRGTRSVFDYRNNKFKEGNYNLVSYVIEPNSVERKTLLFVFKDSTNSIIKLPVYDLMESNLNIDKIKVNLSASDIISGKKDNDLRKEKFEKSKTFQFYKYFTQIDSVEIVGKYVKQNKEEKIRKEKEEKERITNELNSYAKKYGRKYSNYIFSLSSREKEKFFRCAQKWGADTAQKIMKGYVRIGWSKDKCKESWGEPDDINTSIGSWGRYEQWCYPNSYLYFENGILTSIQN